MRLTLADTTALPLWLRIPMRGYEKQPQKISDYLRAVTNPHEGL